MSAREAVRNLVEDLLESRFGAAAILAARGQSIAQRAARQQQQGLKPKYGAAPMLKAASKATNTSKHLPQSTNLSKMFGVNVTSPAPTPQSYQQPPKNPPLQSLQTKAKHKGQTPSNKPNWSAAKYFGKKALSGHHPIGFGAVALAGAVDPGLGLLVRGIQQIFGDQIDRSPFGLSNHNVRDWAKQQIEHSASKADWKSLPSSFEHDAVKNVFSKVKGHMNKAAIKHRVNASKATTHSELRSALEFDESVVEDTSQSPHGTIYGYHNGFWTVNGGPNQPTVSIPSHQVYGHDGVTKIIGKPGMKGRIVKTKKGPAFHSTDDGGPVANPVSKLTIGVDYSA